MEKPASKSLNVTDSVKGRIPAVARFPLRLACLLSIYWLDRLILISYFMAASGKRTVGVLVVGILRSLAPGVGQAQLST